MKYIDADKLKKEIENLKIDFNKFHTGIDPELVKSYLGYRSYDNVLSLIGSLQQEQPEVEFEDKFAKFIEKKDVELGTDTWSEEDLRELALYFYYGRNEDNQPEVDLEKEIDKAMKSDLCPEEISDYDFCRIARHFFNLGLNARK